MEPVNFIADISKVQSMRDGGYRITLDVSSVYATQAAVMLIASDKTARLANVTVEFADAEEEESYGL